MAWYKVHSAFGIYKVGDIYEGGDGESAVNQAVDRLPDDYDPNPPKDKLSAKADAEPDLQE